MIAVDTNLLIYARRAGTGRFSTLWWRTGERNCGRRETQLAVDLRAFPGIRVVDPL